MRQESNASTPILGATDAHSIRVRRLMGSVTKPLDQWRSTTAIQRWTAISFCRAGGNCGRKQGEKGLQDKGSASSALLSVCLHIFLSRDTASRGRDMSLRNDGNLPFSWANRELRPPSPAYFRAGAAGLLVGALRP